MSLDSAQVSLYRKLVCDNNYTIVRGVFALPVAENPPTSASELATWSPVVTVRAVADYRLRTITYAASKELSPPRIPTPEDSGPFVFLGGTISMPFPSINTAGMMTWQVGAAYQYIENVYSDTNSGYVLGQPPFVFTSQALKVGSEVPSQYNPASFNVPQTVSQAGIGPKIGYNISGADQVAEPNFTYSEGSYFPASFHSDDIVCGPDEYPTVMPTELLGTPLDFPTLPSSAILVPPASTTIP